MNVPPPGVKILAAARDLAAVPAGETGELLTRAHREFILEGMGKERKGVSCPPLARWTILHFREKQA